MWDTYRLSITIDRLVAGIPASEKMLDAWLAAKALRMKLIPSSVGVLPDDIPVTPEAAREEHVATIDQVAEVHGVVFYRDSEGRPCYEGRCFKGALKEAANILKGGKDAMPLIDVKAFRAKVAERVFVLPKLVPITVPVETDDRPLTVMTMQGERTSIKRFEFADSVPLSFELRVLQDNLVTERHLRTMLEYMQLNGIGSDRSQGAGTFTLDSFERV